MVYSKYFSFETGPASPKTTAIGLTFTASLLLAFGIFTAQLAYTLDKTGLRVQGEVIGFVESRDNMQSAVFQFSDERGQVRTSRDSLSSSRTAYVIGDKVALVYDKDDPNTVRKDTTFWLYFAPMCLGLMSLLFYGGAALVWRFRSHFQKDYETRRGKVIVTVINSDGSASQQIHSSAPLFYWTGIFFAALGAAAWLGLLGFTLQSLLIDSEIPNASIGVFLVVTGSMLLIVAWALLRHARFLRSLE